MGLSFAAVQRMFLGSFIVAVLTWFLQDSAMDAAMTFIGLSSLVAVVWGLSEKDITFSTLGLNADGVLLMFSFVASIVIFAELCVRVFDFPSVGSYALSLCFIGSFWWTGLPRCRGCHCLTYG